MLNERHDPLSQNSYDINNYRLRRIDRQNVIIAYLSSEVTSNTFVVIVTNHIRFIFSSIIFDLIINIDDETPSVKNDIQLNNVIINKSVETFDEVI